MNDLWEVAHVTETQGSQLLEKIDQLQAIAVGQGYVQAHTYHWTVAILFAMAILIGCVIIWGRRR